MKTFALYHHPQMGYEAVKQGFSWPGFWFTWIWAFVKKLYGIGVVLLMSLIVLRVLIETRELALVWLGAVGSLVVVLIVGFQGNSWRENKLMDRGYQQVETLQAENAEAAIARLIQREAVTTGSSAEAGRLQPPDNQRLQALEPLLAGLKQYDTVMQTLLRGLELRHARIVLNSHLQQLADLDLGHMLIQANIFEAKDELYLGQLRPVLESIHSAATAAGKYLGGGARMATSLQDVLNSASEVSRKNGDYPPALYTLIPNVLMVTQSCLNHIAKNAGTSVHEKEAQRAA